MRCSLLGSNARLKAWAAILNDADLEVRVPSPAFMRVRPLTIS
jgi:hypothetical protein